MGASDNVTEIDEIRALYDSGACDGIKQDLARFIGVHRAEIRRYQESRQRLGLVEVDDALAVRLFIIKHRSINAVSEIQEQLEEINKEKWIQGVKLGREPDPQAVAEEWTHQHSAGWRAHRVATVLYVFDRDKERFLSVYRDLPPTQKAG